MFFKLKLTEKQNIQLESLANDSKMDKQTFICKALGFETPLYDLAELAFKRIKETDNEFCLYDLISDKWENVSNGEAGVIGRNFKRLCQDNYHIVGKKKIELNNNVTYFDLYKKIDS